MPGKPYEENPSPSGPLVTLTLQRLWLVEEIPPLDRRPSESYDAAQSSLSPSDLIVTSMYPGISQ